MSDSGLDAGANEETVIKGIICSMRELNIGSILDKALDYIYIYEVICRLGQDAITGRDQRGGGCGCRRGPE